MNKKFATPLLDLILKRKKKEREELRFQLIEKLFDTLNKLRRKIPFREAYLFGSIVKSYKFFKGSAADIGFIGLKDEYFLMPCLSSKRYLSKGY